jgi:hypothetical protein
VSQIFREVEVELPDGGAYRLYMRDVLAVMEHMFSKVRQSDLSTKYSPPQKHHTYGNLFWGPANGEFWRDMEDSYRSSRYPNADIQYLMFGEFAFCYHQTPKSHFHCRSPF